mgnify:FL=1
MARRFPTFVVLLPVLAACSTTAPVDVPTDASVGGAVYLDGVTTRYAVCLDELPAAQRSQYASSLKNAVVAGDASMTAAASLFRSDGVFTLDLVLCNHGDRPLALDRARIKLYDGMGNPLEALTDWEGGVDHGLRAEQTTVTAYDMLGSSAPRPGGSVAGRATKGGSDAGIAPDLGTPMTTTSVLEEDLRVVRQDFTLPAVVTVRPERHAPYWAYWRARDVEGPLRVTLRVDDKRMVFEFEVP